MTQATSGKLRTHWLECWGLRRLQSAQLGGLRLLEIAVRRLLLRWRHYVSVVLVLKVLLARRCRRKKS